MSGIVGTYRAGGNPLRASELAPLRALTRRVCPAAGGYELYTDHEFAMVATSSAARIKPTAPSETG